MQTCIIKDKSGQWWRLGSRGRARAEKRHCELCGKEFGYYKTASTSIGKYCSVNCANKNTKNGRNVSGDKHPNWRGGKTINKEGYISIRIGPRKLQLEHRMVMENHLGRKLFDFETIHHKNGNKGDNKIDNLELRIGRHGKHQNYEDFINYIMIQNEIIALDEQAKNAIILTLRNIFTKGV